jgi:hypothetical protein
LTLVGILALTGCGGGVGKLEPVEGKVEVAGQPVTGGDVTFVPVEPPKGVPLRIQGKIGSDGRYKMTTNEKPGVPKGKYKVAVNTTAAVAGGQDPGGLGKGPPPPAKAPERIANAKYEDAEKSGLSIEVPTGPYDLKLDK